MSVAAEAVAAAANYESKQKNVYFIVQRLYNKNSFDCILCIGTAFPCDDRTCSRSSNISSPGKRMWAVALQCNLFRRHFVQGAVFISVYT